MSDYKCPHCDAPFTLPEDSRTVTCPYCNTTIQVSTGEILKEHYLMRLQFDKDRARETMLGWAMKQLGAPKDLDRTDLKSSELVFWPFWVIEVEARAHYEGEQKKPDFGGKATVGKMGWKSVREDGDIAIERDIFVAAAKKVPPALTSYVIPTRRKEFFTSELVRSAGGTLRPTVLERNAAVGQAKKEMDSVVHQEAKKEVDYVRKMTQQLAVPAVFLLHVPVWHLRYAYRLRRYDAMVDGASGRVIYMEFPRKLAFRAMAVTGGMFHLAVGGAAAVVLVYLGITRFDLLFPSIAGIVFGLGMLAFALRLFYTAISLRGGEEEAA